MRYSISTPSLSKVEIGPLTVHFYALCILTGIAVAIWLGDRRLRAQGELEGVDYKNLVGDIAFLAVPFGIIGGRIYHVITSPDAYFGKNGHLIDIYKIWEGGLGIWGAIAFGALGAWIALKRISRPIPSFAVFADAIAPGILFAQAIGRFGNWFNGELYGSPLNSWWALEIPPSLRLPGYYDQATYHPTFLYEAIWCSLLALVLIQISKRFQPGQIFALYVAGYSFGRFFIEGIRIDAAHTFFGMRLNQWVAIALFLAALTLFRRFGRRIG